MDNRRTRVHPTPGVLHRRTARLAMLTGVALGPSVVCSVLGRAPHPPAASTRAMLPLVFDGATVVDVQQGRLLPDQRVVIVGNRIRSMGSVRTVKLPARAQVVDARGKYLIPGLWDMHTHPSQYRTNDGVPYHATEFFYTVLIANGVTGIRDAGAKVPLDTLRLWRQEILHGTRVGPPRQLLSGPPLDEETRCTRDDPLDWHICVSVASAHHVIDSLKAAGVDMIKMYDLSQRTYFVVAAEARRAGLPFGGHIQQEERLTAAEASDSGARILDHEEFAGGLDTLCWSPTASIERCRAVADLLRRNGTWWVPTFVSSDPADMGHPASIPIFDQLRQFTIAFEQGAVFHPGWLHASTTIAADPWVPVSASKATGRALRLAHQVGLPILAGTDGGPDALDNKKLLGFSLHTELAMYVAEGLTPVEALQAATLNPARAFHLTDSLGTVAPGKLADLIVLDADPLMDITNTTAIRAVVANGRYFDRAALDRLLADAQVTVKSHP